MRVKGVMNPWLSFGIVTVIVYLLVVTMLSAFLKMPSLATNLYLGLVFTLALVFGAKGVGLIGGSVPFTKQVSAGLAVVALIAVFFVPGLFAGAPAAPSLTSQAGQLVTQPAQAVATPTGVSVSSCEASVSPDIKGTSATINLNAYNLEEDSPFAAARDTGTVYIFRGDNVQTSTDFITSVTDTTANAVTGFKVGEVVSMAGGNTGNYTDAKNGVCVNGQQTSVNLDNHHLQGEGSYNTTVYDSTGSTELGAGTAGVDYGRALGASEIQQFAWKLKNNAANAAIRLCAFGFTTGTNLSDVKPAAGDETLFTKVPTPLFARNVVTLLGGFPGDATLQKDYVIWKLNQPRLLKEFNEFTFKFTIEATNNDPTGAVNLTTWSGVNGIALDCGWNRGSDGKMYDDVHDHSSTEGNAGRAETLTSPGGKTSGFMLTIT